MSEYLLCQMYSTKVKSISLAETEFVVAFARIEMLVVCARELAT